MRRAFQSAVFTAFLLSSFSAPAAASSADLNGDGSLDISDAVHLLSYLFLGTELGNPASDQRKVCILAFPHMYYRTLEQFADNGDGTFTDKITGLTWQRSPGPWISLTWEDRGKTTILERAVEYCEDLVLGGREDWRLPNIIELLSLNPGYCIAADYRTPCPLHEFLGLPANDWQCLLSSTSVAGQSGAWVYAVGAWEGRLTISDDGFPLCVRGGKPRGSGGRGAREDLNSDGQVDISDAIFLLGHLFLGGAAPDEESCLMATGVKESIVPGDDGYYQAGIPQPSERFVDLGNGAVRDQVTGLLWMKKTSNFTYESEPPEDYVREAEESTGFSGWERPRVDDLASIIDFSRAGPAANPIFEFSDPCKVQSMEFAWRGSLRVIVDYSGYPGGVRNAPLAGQLATTAESTGS